MGVALAGAAIAGTALSAYGNYEAGQSQAKSAAYQAQVAANNAAIAKQNATWDIQAGEIAAVNKGLQTKAKVGAEKAGQAAAGVDVNTGSAVDTRAGTAELGMLDAMTSRSNASKEAYGQEVAATSDTAQGQLLTMQGQQAATAGDIGAGASLLSGASTVGNNWANWQNKFGSNYNWSIPGIG